MPNARREGGRYKAAAQYDGTKQHRASQGELSRENCDDWCAKHGDAEVEASDECIVAWLGAREVVRIKVVGEEDAVGLCVIHQTVKEVFWKVAELTDTIPQVKQLTVKQVATHTQP